MVWKNPDACLHTLTALDKTVVAAQLAGWFTVLLAAIGGAIKIATTRESLIGLFASEIKALQFGLSNVSMFDFWQKVYENSEKRPVGFADVPRQENHFQYFDTLGDNSGNLHRSGVEAIVRFYIPKCRAMRCRRCAAGTRTGKQPCARRSCRQSARPIDVMGLHLSSVHGLQGEPAGSGFSREADDQRR